jgi:uncharacterized membrane protein YdjX (TVP38/TMEM64 family)
MDSDRSASARKWIVGGLVIAAAVAIGGVVGHRDLSAEVDRVIEACRSAGPEVYFGAMAILPIFGFSLFAFVASAGPIFAPTLGVGPVIGCGLGALAVNVSLSYLLARRALRPLAERLIRHFGWALPDVCRYGPWEVAFLTRLLPGPPFGLQSCLLGVAGMPFGIYLVTSLAVPALYFSGMVCLSSGAAMHSPWAAGGAGLALVLVGWAAHRLRLRLTRPWPGGSSAALPEAG